MSSVTVLPLALNLRRTDIVAFAVIPVCRVCCILPIHETVRNVCPPEITSNEYISLFAMLAEIEALDLGLTGNAEADRRVEQLEY
jgi:hypothetical protein